MGEGTRPATICSFKRCQRCLREGEKRGGGGLFLTPSHRPGTCSLSSKKTLHTTTRHTACNNSSQNLAPATSCPSQKGHQAAAGPPLWHVFSSAAVRIFESDPSRRRTTSQHHVDCPGNHTSARKSWPALGFVTRLLTPQAAGLRSTPLPLGSD